LKSEKITLLLYFIEKLDFVAISMTFFENERAKTLINNLLIATHVLNVGTIENQLIK